MLTRVAAKNYKNLRIENGIELKNLNILIGPNGSGKSNVIALLDFLKTCLNPVNPDTQQTGFEQAVMKLGSRKFLDASLPTNNSVLLSYDIDSTRLEVKIKVYNESCWIEYEAMKSLSSELSHYVFNQGFPEDDGKVMVINDQKQNALSIFNIPNKDLGLRIFESLIQKEIPDVNIYLTTAYQVRIRFIEQISSWKIFNANHMNIESIRANEPRIGRSDVMLSSAGDNLMAVLYNLCRDIDFDEKLTNAMRSILPNTRKIRPFVLGQQTIVLEWFFNEFKDAFYLSDLSDGTIRMLCWATILHSHKLPSLIIIEEPEVGLHPAWLAILAEWIKAASQKTQIMITTHSPDLLDHFTDHLESVLIFRPDKPDAGHCVVERLTNDRVATWLADGWQLGDLYRVGDPSVGGWPW